MTRTTTDVCGTCDEPVVDHTVFGRQLAGDDPAEVWHRVYCGRDAKPSDAWFK